MLALGREVPEQAAVRLVRRMNLKQLVGPLIEIVDLQTELVGVDDIALVA